MKKIAVVGLPGSWSSEELADTVEKKTGFRLLIDMEKTNLDLGTNQVFFQDHDLTQLDAVIIKKIGSKYSPSCLDRLEILRYLQNVDGVPIFSNPDSIVRLLNRLNCTTILRQNNIPMPHTVITENVELAVKTVQDFKKAVFKPLFTSKARGMEVITAEMDIATKVKEFQNQGNTVMYIQKMIEHLQKDLGLMFLGGEYLGTYARVKNDENTWNTTTQSGGKYQSYEPSQEIIELANKSQKLFAMDFTCVDVVETSDGPKVFEVSAFGGFKGLLNASGIHAGERYVDYVLGKLNE